MGEPLKNIAFCKKKVKILPNTYNIFMWYCLPINTQLPNNTCNNLEYFDDYFSEFLKTRKVACGHRAAAPRASRGQDRHRHLGFAPGPAFPRRGGTGLPDRRWSRSGAARPTAGSSTEPNSNRPDV